MEKDAEIARLQAKLDALMKDSGNKGLLVYGLDLVEIDDSIFREYPAVFLHFDNHRFNVIRESPLMKDSGNKG